MDPTALKGVRVLDLSRVLDRPYCTILLGEHFEEILIELLDCIPDDIARLQGEDVI